MKILLIDDNPIDLMLNERVVKGINPEAEILKFKSGIEALEYASEHQENIDIMLVDIKMPFMNGFQFLEELEKLGLQDKVKSTYILSSSIDPVDIQRSEESTMVKGFIEKPLSMQKLQAFLSAV